ncbi:MAG: hypothetical protein R6X08_12140, partial [Desulfosalsimonadaceae bacterium]
PLIQVMNASGGQPITVEPEVMKMSCAPGMEGYLVFFGTGQYIGTEDFENASQQSFYGVWDWQANWPENEQKTKYLGNFVASDSSPVLSHAPSTADSLTLLEQTTTTISQGWRSNTDYQVDYFNPPDGDDDAETDHAGWYFNLVNDRSRVIRNPTVRPGTGEDEGIVTFISSVPSESPCAAGGSSWLYQVSACSGGRTSDPQFDVTGEGKIDEQDVINSQTTSGKSFEEMLYSPIQVSDNLYLNDSTGDIKNVKIDYSREGISYWRVIQ